MVPKYLTAAINELHCLNFECMGISSRKLMQNLKSNQHPKDMSSLTIGGGRWPRYLLAHRSLSPPSRTLSPLCCMLSRQHQPSPTPSSSSGTIRTSLVHCTLYTVYQTSCEKEVLSSQLNLKVSLPFHP